jgi:ribosomal protein S18 acetylase RimI-like enzyme
MTTESALHLHPLHSNHWQAFRELRLMSITDSPLAIYPTYDEEASRSSEEIQDRIAESATQVVFGAFDGDTLVGIAGLRWDPLVQVAHKAVLWGVFVRPDWRRGGLARRLLRELFAYARARGVTQVKLSVNTENEKAAALYRSLGFEVYGREPRAMRVGGRYHDEDLMLLCLEKA